MNEEFRNPADASNNHAGTAASGCLGWGAELSADSSYSILTEDDYRFRITNFERAHHPGSEKVPACPQAKLTARVEYNGRTVDVRFNLLLHESMEWRLASFFRCIGLKKKGERMTMDWTKVPGARGMFHLKPAHFTDACGREHDTNRVAYFLDYDPALWPVSVSPDEEPDWLEEAAESLPF